jgi:leukotriene-A4 hydrolase
MNAMTTEFLFAVLVCVVAGCASVSPQMAASSEAPLLVRDPHSYARPDEIAVTHLDLDVAVDFAKKSISGTAALTVDNRKGATKLVLDTRDLAIDKVTLGADEQPTTFALGPLDKYLGRALTIDVRPDTKRVTVRYSTSPTAAALQWLEPAQTAGKRQPFLYTQGESILTRTWVPCQDSPGVRMTYHARVRVPPELMAVMSASNSTHRHADGVYEFDMKQPVPPYLLALGVGDLEFASLGSPRCGVYAEPPVLDRAAWEFGETEKMVAAAESLYGPYRWDRYDLLVLPPSFPFGGMENPRLTFATPTVLAGDRSLVSLVAHELAHSWSGNLVTNATWNDFWLNEGFTVYFEERIMEAVYGRDYSEMLAQLGLDDLKKTIADLAPDDTHLFLNLEGRDPDDGTNDVAYQKGYFFLRKIEETVGRAKFDSFLRGYFDRFAFRSMTTDRFVAYLRSELVRDPATEQAIAIDAWVYGPGIPPNCSKIQSRALADVEAAARAYLAGTPASQLQTKGWVSHQWVHFVRQLPNSLTPAQMADLDTAFHFTGTGNSEVLVEWLTRAIATKYEAAYPALEAFLTGMGRRKYLKPLYAEMAKTPDGLAMARRIYAKARPTYHSVSTNTIDDILKWPASSN